MAYGPTSFYRPTYTVLGASQIISGQAAPGTNVPIRATAVPSMLQQLYRKTTADYESLGPTGMGPVTSEPLGPIDTRVDFRIDRSLTGEGLADPYGRGAVFQTLPGSSRLPLAREIQEFQEHDTRIDNRVRPQGELAVQPLEWGPDGRPIDRREPNQPPEGGPGLPPPGGPNQDVFTDLIVGLARVRSSLAQPPQGQEPREAPEGPRLVEPNAPAAPSGTGESASARPPAEPNLPDELNPPDERNLPIEPAGPGAARTRKVEITRDNKVVLRGLAGISEDQFNRYMAQAEGLLKAAKYYRSAVAYDKAIVLRPQNPLAHLGLAIGLLGAGEPLRAGYQLRRAMQLFPPLMEAGLDLREMLSEKTLRDRLDLIHARLAEPTQAPEPLLVFLLAYVHQNTGERSEAGADAERLRKLAGDDKLLAAYAEYVLTGRRPGPRRPASSPATQPAGVN
jgi:hypothetical protein